MFDFFRRHTRVLQFVLVLLVFPAFAFVGIQGYSRFTGGDQQAVAKVGGQSITQLELDNAIRERVERTRRQMPTIDPKLFDTPEMRRLAVDALVRERVLLIAADKLHLMPADDRLDRLFKNDPDFQTLRNPDGSVNRDALAGLRPLLGRLRRAPSPGHRTAPGVAGLAGLVHRAHHGHRFGAGRDVPAA